MQALSVSSYKTNGIHSSSLKPMPSGKNFNPHHKNKVSFGIGIKQLSDINNLKKCDSLFVLAHPDDEVCFFGFLAKMLKNPKERIQLVYTTMGQKGKDVRHAIKRYSINKMGAQRQSELEKALDKIHLREEPLCLGMMDGETHLPENRNILKKHIRQILDITKPKDVYSFDGSGITGHTDHIMAGRTCRELISRNNNRNMRLWGVGLTQKNVDDFLNNTFRPTQIFRFVRPSVERPDIMVDIHDEVPQIISAFREYKSQFTDKACDTLEKHFLENSKINIFPM